MKLSRIHSSKSLIQCQYDSWKRVLPITFQWNLNDNGNDQYICLKIFWDCLQLSKYSKKLNLTTFLFLFENGFEKLAVAIIIKISVAIFLSLLLAIFFLNYLFIFLTVNSQYAFDMCHGKTRVTSYELHIESLKARVESLKERAEIQKCKFRSTSYEFIFTSYEFKSTNYEFKSTNHEFKFTKY